MALQLIATCVLGLEEILATELRELGALSVEPTRGAVTFKGSWRDCWRANWRLRTANRVLVELGSWPAGDGDQLARGAMDLVLRNRRGGIDVAALLHPSRTFSIRATVGQSRIRDLRWAALKLKDGLVDAQRQRFGQRASIDRSNPDLYLRLRLHRDHATLTLDTSGESLDHRGYRVQTVAAPVREQLAAACVLAAGWDGTGPVVDPMCGSGTLLAEAAFIAQGLAPGHLRRNWAFEKLPAYDRTAFEKIRRELLPIPGPDVRVYGIDRDPSALRAAERNLYEAGLSNHVHLQQGDAFDQEPPEGPGLLVINPAYGERLEENTAQWRRLGDLMKQHYRGWKAVILAGDAEKGKQIGLRPSRRIPVMNGPLEARILVFELY
jgi:putative N6-adenine-specific DNA methylase